MSSFPKESDFSGVVIIIAAVSILLALQLENILQFFVVYLDVRPAYSYFPLMLSQYLKRLYILYSVLYMSVQSFYPCYSYFLFIFANVCLFF